ncbi:MAG: triose-phosphate isomerase [Saprospiraceae bacterium]|nr:triose-phosphate isomerase [Saprospiraceae bacterium]MBP6567330.1 triose-phosphate isomerase [Saprospiraceae bacterium]
MMSRKNIAAGNWKMNTTIEEGIDLAQLIAGAERSKEVITILGVPFTHIYPLQKKIKVSSKVLLAAQNCHHKTSGAYTGEISPTMLAAMKVPYVIIGHSERREYNHEDNALLASKLRAALDAGLKVIFCCGEALDIRKADNHVSHVKNQLVESLFQLDAKEMKNIVIAYEPIWAIGTGETASPAQAQEMHAAIRSMLQIKYGKRVAENTSILYGGSVKGNNAKELFSQPDVDGGLVGGASLNGAEFVQIINSF